MSRPRNIGRGGESKAPEHSTVTEWFSNTRSDYAAAQETRFTPRLTGSIQSGSGADYHIRSSQHYYKIMERARLLDRNDQIVGQGITRAIDAILQLGTCPEPDTGVPKLDDELKARWKVWAASKDCDISRRFNLHSLAKFALRGNWVDGDTFVIPTKNRDIEILEAHRCRSPYNQVVEDASVVHGVEINKFRRPLRYWFTTDEIGWNSRARQDKFTPRKAEEVLHLLNPKRYSATRGVSLLAPIVDTAGMFDDLQFAKLVQSEIVSCFAILRERPLDEFTTSAASPATGTETTQLLQDGGMRILEGIAPGMDITSLAGEKISGFSPNVPNTEYFQHAMLILCVIAVNIGLPVHVLLLDPSKTNFSGWRGAMDQARAGFMQWWSWMVDQYYRPVYKWWVLSELENKELTRLVSQSIKKKGELGPVTHEFTPPYYPYIEPEKDAKADDLIVKSLLNSHRDVLGRRGLDITTIQRDIVSDNGAFLRLALAEAEAIKKEFPDAGITWREILFLTSSSEKPAPPKPFDKKGFNDDSGDDNADANDASNTDS